jgi:hypothetical protein
MPYLASKLTVDEEVVYSLLTLFFFFFMNNSDLIEKKHSRKVYKRDLTL